VKTRYILEFFLFRIIQLLLFPFPRKIYIGAGKLAGSFFFKILKNKRKIAIENLKLAFGKELGEREIEKIAKKCFQHFGVLIFDLLWLMKKGKNEVRKITKIKGIEILKEIKKSKKGGLILSAHFGNWEIVPHALALEGFPLNSIARKFDNPYLDRVLNKFRERYGNRIIYKQDAKREAIEILKKGDFLGILADQNTLKDHGVFVNFFGKPACTATGLAIFHMKYGSPIIPVFCYPDKDYNYTVEIKEPFQAEPEDDILKITEKYTKIIEDEIRKSPHLWLWIHQRWKEKP
jgi:KDO2-lipid IV(A) lauroyltransferase